MEPTADLVIRACRAVLGTGADAAPQLAEEGATVVVTGGVITGILPLDAPVEAREEIVLAEHLTLLPGGVDPHVHVNEPGRTHWEGFTSATRAAAAGGMTTIVDMPLNSIPPTVDPEALAIKQSAASPQVSVDVGFWGGAIPSSLGTLGALHERGVFGFKAFLSPSGVDEFPHLDRAQLRVALEEIAAISSTLIVHAEDPTVLDAHAHAGRQGYREFMDSRPDAAETEAVQAVIDGVRATGARAHILHVSSAEVLPLIAAAKAEGLPITAETCPHYLSFSAEEIPDGATQYKCCPPIREAGNRERLWQGLAEGVIDFVASDHSPSTEELKFAGDGDFAEAWGGISGLQLSLAAVLTGALARGHELVDVVRWTSHATSRFLGLADRGALAVGRRADLVALDAQAEFTVEASALEHRNPVSAFDGSVLRGRVERTWLAGETVFERGRPAETAGRGGLVARPGV